MKSVADGSPTSTDEALKTSVGDTTPTKSPALKSVVGRPVPTTSANSNLMLVGLQLTDYPQDLFTYSLPHMLPLAESTIARFTYFTDCLIGGLSGMLYKDLQGGINHRHTSHQTDCLSRRSVGNHQVTSSIAQGLTCLGRANTTHYSTRPDLPCPLNFKFWLGVQNPSAPVACHFASTLVALRGLQRLWPQWLLPSPMGEFATALWDQCPTMALRRVFSFGSSSCMHEHSMLLPAHIPRR
eukprot:Gb_33228 [translate_table: standard]